MQFSEALCSGSSSSIMHCDLSLIVYTLNRFDFPLCAFSSAISSARTFCVHIVVLYLFSRCFQYVMSNVLSLFGMSFVDNGPFLSLPLFRFFACAHPVCNTFRFKQFEIVHNGVANPILNTSFDINKINRWREKKPYRYSLKLLLLMSVVPLFRWHHKCMVSPFYYGLDSWVIKSAVTVTYVERVSQFTNERNAAFDVPLIINQMAQNATI